MEKVIIEVKEYIKDGDFGKAFDAIINATEENFPRFHDDFILLQGRYNSIKREILEGKRDSDIEINKVRELLLVKINELKIETKQEKFKKESLKTEKPDSNFLKRAFQVFFIGIIVVLAIINYLKSKDIINDIDEINLFLLSKINKINNKLEDLSKNLQFKDFNVNTFLDVNDSKESISNLLDCPPEKAAELIANIQEFNNIILSCFSLLESYPDSTNIRDSLLPLLEENFIKLNKTKIHYLFHNSIFVMDWNEYKQLIKNKPSIRDSTYIKFEKSLQISKNFTAIETSDYLINISGSRQVRICERPSLCKLITVFCSVEYDLSKISIDPNDENKKAYFLYLNSIRDIKIIEE